MLLLEAQRRPTHDHRDFGFDNPWSDVNLYPMTDLPGSYQDTTVFPSFIALLGWDEVHAFTPRTAYLAGSVCCEGIILERAESYRALSLACRRLDFFAEGLRSWSYGVLPFRCWAV